MKDLFNKKKTSEDAESCEVCGAGHHGHEDHDHDHHEEGCCHSHNHDHSHEHHHDHEHGHEHHHDHEHHHEHGEEEEDLSGEKRKLILAGAIFAALLLLEHAVKAPFMENRFVNMILYMIPWLIAGFNVIKEAAESLVHGELLGEEFLMAIASLGAFVTGENAEAAAVLLFYSLGELLQDIAVDRSRDSIKDMMNIAPEYANLCAKGGSFAKVDPDVLRIGDLVAVLPGERIPVDGTVIAGDSMVDTSSLTGESVPKSVHPGDSVISGCINGSQDLRVRVDKEYRNSTVAKVLELTEEASDRKSPTEDFISRFARIYTPVVVGLALLLCIVPPVFTGAPFLMWLRRACTFLVISCPCALVISIPLSFFGGIGAASRKGILVKGSGFLEALTHVKTFASDKTGTLTEGSFRPVKVMLPDGAVTSFSALQGSGQEEAVRSLFEKAALAESLSTHPIAESIREAARTLGISGKVPETGDTSVENLSGRGVKLHLSENVILAGNEKLLSEEGVSFTPCGEAGTLVYIAENGAFAGVIVIADTVKDSAAAAISDLRALGVTRTVMLTGDRQAPAERIKAETGLSEVYAELLPQDKVAVLEKLIGELSDGEKLLYAGDGINDAPVLKRADIGLAMGSMGSDAAIEAADVVLMDDDIAKIPAVIRIAKKTMRLSRQNIAFALSVKVLFLVLGALGISGMWMAVFADVGVALLCVLNAMRSLRA